MTSEVTETSEASQVSRIVDNEVRRLTSTKTYNKGTVRTIEDDYFYKLQLVVDKKTGKFSYYLDGELLEKDVTPFHNSAEETLVNVVTALYRYNEAAENYNP